MESTKNIKENEDFKIGENYGNRIDVKMKLKSEDLTSGVLNDNYSDSYEQLKYSCMQQCPLCNCFLDNRYILLQHNLTHLNIILNKYNNFRDHQCYVCDIYFNSDYKLKMHMKKHKSEYEGMDSSSNLKIYPCGECNKMYTFKTWRSHMKEVHCNPQFKCDNCDNTFKCMRYLRRHVLKKHGVELDRESIMKGEFKCLECPAKWNSRKALLRHVRNCHSEGTTCHICDRKLKSKAYLASHLNRIHNKFERDYECNLCDKKYRLPRFLTAHTRQCHPVLRNVNSDVKHQREDETNSGIEK